MDFWCLTLVDRYVVVVSVAQTRVYEDFVSGLFVGQLISLPDLELVRKLYLDPLHQSIHGLAMGQRWPL